MGYIFIIHHSRANVSLIVNNIQALPGKVFNLYAKVPGASEQNKLLTDSQLTSLLPIPPTHPISESPSCAPVLTPHLPL